MSESQNPPSGWGEAPLGSMADFIMGQAPPGSQCNTSGVGTVFVKAGDFGNGRPLVREWTTQPLKMARESDVFICVVGATAGKINLGIDCAIGRSVAAIRPMELALDQFYLYQFLKTKVISLRGDSAGSAQGVISKEDLAAIEVPLAPLAEQRRIVAKLDALQSRTRLAREALAAIPALLDHYRQSVLAAAFRGELTKPATERVDASNPEGWDPGIEQATWAFDDLPVGWSWLRFDEIADDCTDSRRKLKTDGYRPSGKYPVIDQGEASIAGWSDDESLVQTAKPPFVLFGDHTRKVQSVAVSFIQGADGLKVYKATTRVLPDYLACLLRGISIPDKGYSRHAKFITAARYPVPPPETQRMICDVIQRAWIAADRMAATVANMVSAGNYLDQSLLATAFRGELVPQDPADEPASVLLDRIRAARAQAGDAPRTRRPRTPAAAPPPARAAEPATPYRAAASDPYATILAALRAKGSLASADAQAATGLDAAAVRPLLQRLVAEGAAKVEGRKRGTRYVTT